MKVMIQSNELVVTILMYMYMASAQLKYPAVTNKGYLLHQCVGNTVVLLLLYLATHALQNI